MSVIAPPIVNTTLVKSMPSSCYNNNFVCSQGLFIGDNPLTFTLPLLLLEISIIFIISNALHFILKPLGQSRVVSQVLTGVLMGRSLIGRSDTFRETMFPVRGVFILDTISLVSLTLFLFSVGVKTDLSLLKRPGWRAVGVGFCGSLLPIILSFTVYFTARNSLSVDLVRSNILIGIAVRLSLSSFAVIGDALQEHGLLNTDLGRIALSAALITDVCNWVIMSVSILVLLVVKAKSPEMAVSMVASLVAFVLLVFFVARPMAMWAIRRTPAGELVKEGVFVAMVVAAFLAAFASELFGFHATLGPIVLGLAIPGGMPIGVTLSERLDSFVTGLLLPAYLALAGYRTNLTDLGGWDTWGWLEIIILTCFVGKFVGSVLAALYFKMPLKDAFVLGIMVNIKGIIEVSYINSIGDSEDLTTQHFSVLMISVLLITSVTNPLVKFLYDPNICYVSRKRRTIEHMKPDSDFRILVVVQFEDDVPPLLDLLEALHPHPSSPLNLIILHLTELSGNAASILRPHRLRPRDDTGNPSLTDHIVAAFRHFADAHPHGSLQIHPFISASPPPTMHNDVCYLALHRKARLIILPFHRPLTQRVMDHAPCSVVVLVVGSEAATCRRENARVERVAVVFLGGGDDREAMAVGGRMAGGGLEVTVVRVRGRGEQAVMEDDEAVDRVRRMDGVEYLEKVVGDGEGTVGVVRGMGERFDVVVVGKRKGMEGDGAATKGIEEWSQCPELGVLGDMLAAVEIGGKAAILVVQQQAWAGNSEGVGEEAKINGLITRMVA